MKPWSTFVLLATSLGALPLAAQSEAGTYQAVTMRAAPGHLLDLIAALKARMPVYLAAGEPKPVLLRHAQGDQWDLLLLVPIESIAEHFSREYAGRWQAALTRTGFDDGQFERQLDQWISWREELYVNGPSVTALESAVASAGYFHLEIFQALAGKRDSLRREREMENDFLVRINRPTNFIFGKITGSAWDAFTIGFYRDLQHYAEPSSVTADAEEVAAKAAGFESRGHLGPYLRQLIGSHHDTLGSVVK